MTHPIVHGLSQGAGTVRRFFILLLTLSMPLLVQASEIIPVEGVGTETLPLSVVVRSASVGYRFENLGEEAQNRWDKQAQAYIRFKRGRMTPQEKALSLADCIASPASNPYCEFMLERVRTTARVEEKARARSLDQVAQWMVQADLDELEGVPDRQIFRALRTFQKWEPLRKVAEAALASDSCDLVGLQTSLAQKSEEFFPNPEHVKTAIGLYSRADACAEGELLERARYRLSLLQIYSGECRKAEPTLLKLALLKDGNYISRAMYWRAHCAKVSGNRLLHDVLRGRLVKDYPLSYHSLLSGKDRISQRGRMLDVREPSVRFRTAANGEANLIVRAAEVLQTYGAPDLSAELLNGINERLEMTEPEFRLYIAVLLSRAGDAIGKFRMLTSAFKDSPTLISRSTLELFYPLKRFEDLKTHSARIDPYLVAALIRQESGFNERARSPAGAMGLMQLMPATARRMERVSRRQLYNPDINIRLGVRYFYHLLDRYGSDVELALAAYNAGPEKVDDWQRRYKTDDRVLFMDLIPYKETRDYVALISRNYFWYLALYEEQTEADPRKRALLFTLFSKI